MANAALSELGAIKNSDTYTLYTIHLLHLNWFIVSLSENVDAIYRMSIDKILKRNSPKRGSMCVRERTDSTHFSLSFALLGIRQHSTSHVVSCDCELRSLFLNVAISEGMSIHSES